MKNDLPGAPEAGEADLLERQVMNSDRDCLDYFPAGYQLRDLARPEDVRAGSRIEAKSNWRECLRDHLRIYCMSQ